MSNENLKLLSLALDVDKIMEAGKAGPVQMFEAIQAQMPEGAPSELPLVVMADLLERYSAGNNPELAAFVASLRKVLAERGVQTVEVAGLPKEMMH